MIHKRTVIVAMVILLAGLAGCRKPAEQVNDPRRPAVDAAVREKWGKGLDDLPTVTLIAISPNNEDIQNEFEWAFSLWHARHFGQKVDIRWRDVGGGGSAIEQALRNRFADSDTAGIDILWGGGDLLYIKLASEGLLTAMALEADVVQAVPETLGGITLRDPENRWVGTAVSAFGFLYNKGRLEQLGIDPPVRWEDLGADAMFGHLCLADPTESGSAKAAMELIIQSAPDWPAGWGRLVDIASNASQFVTSASGAADAPVQGTAVVATAIDFYGVNRVVEHPGELVFVLPEGQTVFTPDPIAVLKNPPNPEVAQRFVNFVMSLEGQALLTFPVGSEGGPIEHVIRRTPIRRDFTAAYADRLPTWTINPYVDADRMELDMTMRDARFQVLGPLVRMAAIANKDELKAAREQLIAQGNPAEGLAALHALPANVQTLESLRATSALLTGEEEDVVEVLDGWGVFFREQYDKAGR